MSRDKNSSYYDVGGIEVLDVIKAKLTPEQYKGYLLGNAMKYALRSNHKGTFKRDMEKCANYSKWLSDIEEPIVPNNSCFDKDSVQLYHWPEHRGWL